MLLNDFVICGKINNKTTVSHLTLSLEVMKKFTTKDVAQKLHGQHVLLKLLSQCQEGWRRPRDVAASSGKSSLMFGPWVKIILSKIKMHFNRCCLTPRHKNGNTVSKNHWLWECLYNCLAWKQNVIQSNTVFMI